MWETSIEVAVYSHAPRRDAFLQYEETYDNWLFMALDSGRFHFQIGKGVEKLEGECGPGDWVVCPPGQCYRRVLIQDLTFHYVRFHCTNPVPLHAMVGKNTLLDGQLLRSRLQSLPAAMGQPDGLKWVAHVVRDLVVTWHWEQRHSVTPRLLDPVLETCRAFLEHHANEEVDLAQLATRHRMAPATFSRRFKAAYGLAPSQYLMERRLMRAREMLLESNLSLQTIARAAGLGSGLYLSRVWRQRYGETPGQYRKQHRV